MPPTTIGPYEVLATLGSGGMGEVFLAKSPIASLVALKVIRRNLSDDPDVRTRFMGEVDHLRMAFGSRVARFEGADLNADPPWLAVEYIRGVTLRQHVERHGPVPEELGAILGAVLAEGVQAIHDAGLVHRIHRSMIAFMRGIRTPLSTTVVR
jgi:eukaryotic-like serine/threonine-protein kinase